MVSEFEFIENIKSNYGLERVGDDCAVLPKDEQTDQLLTTDLLVEDVDFRLEWTTPEFLGHKALAVSLSDIAAMGGTPTWAMLSIGIPRTLWNTNFVDKFYEGWFALADKHRVELIGGDLSRSPDKLVIDSIVGGEVEKGRAILRSTAKPGDAILVTGSLGGAGGGLKLLEGGLRFNKTLPFDAKNLVKRQLQPQPQLPTANILFALGLAMSMIDISDGLSSDLDHLCTQNNVGARIDANRIPIDSNLVSEFSNEQSLKMALESGEDFELLFTTAKENISSLEKLDVTQIGEITSNVGIVELIAEGKSRILVPRGFRHF